MHPIDYARLSLQSAFGQPRFSRDQGVKFVSTETGGGLAETLERTGNTIRSRLQMEGKIAALTAQGKLQAWVVGLLPVVLLAALNKLEPVATAMLWQTRAGWATLAVLAIFEIMGIYVIRKIIAIDV